jgi:hypothetical protein
VYAATSLIIWIFIKIQFAHSECTLLTIIYFGNNHSKSHSPNGHSYRAIVVFSTEFVLFLPFPDRGALGDRTAPEVEDARRDDDAADERWFDLLE